MGTVPGTYRSQFPALGTTAVVAVTNANRLSAATAVVAAELTAVDRAYSRFRPDSELMTLCDQGGRTTPVSPLLAAALTAALHAAKSTGGLVDPTVGAAVSALGYDRDFASVTESQRALPAERAVPGQSAIEFDPTRRTARVAPGTQLDLGATGKALAADRAAARAAAATGCGVLVSLGGDVAVAGPAPEGGWAIGIADDHRASGTDIRQTIAIDRGGIATSSTCTRTWRRGGEDCHHIVDPARGRSAEVVWRTVSVAAGSCVAANTASTAAIVEGRGAVARLLHVGLPSRLVAAGGEPVTVGGWPQDRNAAA
ncbi:MAG TPA: FAD:protein FMN transferase [Gaiellales bacterium]|nr:FAD:protein FMN transferase [Gaiellales bacterium]